MFMSTKKRNRYNVQGISWQSEDLLNQAKGRAKRLHISLSNYVSRLVRKDLEAGGPMILQEGPTEPKAAQTERERAQTLAAAAGVAGKEKKKTPTQP